MVYPSTPLIGINLTDANSSPQQVVGVQVETTDDQSYQYAYAGAALSVGHVVHIGLSGTAQNLTPALAATAGDIGFVQTALASGQYGWIARKGRNLNIQVAANTATGTALWTSDTAGQLTTTANTLSQYQVMGVIMSTSSSAAAGAFVGTAQAFPIIRRAASGM